MKQDTELSATSEVHELPSTADTVRVGAMDPAARPVLEIESGDIVHYSNTWLNWGNEPKYGMSFAEREPIRKRYPQGPFSLVGPVAVQGAQPGDAIECRMLRLKPIDWGWNSAPLGVALALGIRDLVPAILPLRCRPSLRRFRQGVRIPCPPCKA